MDALSAAYADGQISGQEHERRVHEAIRADQVSELVALVDDLQLAEGPVRNLMVSAARVREPTPAWKVIARAFGVVAVTAAVITATAVWSSDDPTERLDMRTEQNLDRMVEVVDEEFGSTEVVSAEIGESNTAVRVPVGEGRSEVWYFSRQGLEKYDAGNGRLPEDLGLVDLAGLDRARLLDNLEWASKNLGLDEVESVSIEIAPGPVPDSWRDGGVPATDGHVWIRVWSPYDEVGLMFTDLAGNILVRQPHVAPS
ncbi:DUF1707 domain-containing protein [Nocardioides sp. JQ2195]|nr:DUF1707 domain-containing protein [Nocardioides sp. JQ2195]